MTPPTDANIESVLRDMTTPGKGKPSLWRAALKASPVNAKRKRRFAWLSVFARRPLASAAILLIAVGSLSGIGVVAVSTAQLEMRPAPSRAARDLSKSSFARAVNEASPTRNEVWDLLRRTRGSASMFGTPSTTETPKMVPRFHYDFGRDQITSNEASLDPFRYDEGEYDPSNANLRGIGQAMYVYADEANENYPTTSTGAAKTDTSAPARRQVIRRATVELKTTDVRAVFLKAQQLVMTGRGEYVQDSNISGEGKAARADLTIRVEASRLSEFLNEVRKLGDVQSEALAGDDVTTQVIDLEARLRNEQRVEDEVLKLLETRKDASLDEVLKLRESLAQIRTRIEQMTGQREQFRRLVSLATVLLIIRTGDVPETAPASHWDAFTKALSSAWNNGLTFLGEVVAFIVRVLVGGFIFWLALAGVIIYFRRRVLQRKK